MRNLIEIKEKNGNSVVSARELHEFLESSINFNFIKKLLNKNIKFYKLEEVCLIINKSRIINFYINYCKDNELTSVKELDFKVINFNPYVNVKHFKNDVKFASFYTNSITFIVVQHREHYVSIDFLNNYKGAIKLLNIKGEKVVQKTYLIKDSLGYTKIGKSKTPTIREKTLRSEMPKIYLYAICNENIESKLHKEYGIYRVRGEWFNLSDEQVNEIITKYNFKIIKKRK